jgi:hypothetical protein
LVVEKEKN